MFYCNNSALTIATHDIIIAIDAVTAATDDVTHIICTLLSHHNTSSGGRNDSCFVLHFLLMFLIFISFNVMFCTINTIKVQIITKNMKCVHVLCYKTSPIKVNGRLQKILTFLTYF